MDLKNKTFNEKRDLAYSSNTSISDLRALAKEEDWVIRMYVARNPNTPLDVLRGLTKDEHWRVRVHLAKNPKSSSKILVMQFEYEKSLSEPNKNVIYYLYHNARLPYVTKVIIETLFKDML